jgi:plastocyanin
MNKRTGIIASVVAILVIVFAAAAISHNSNNMKMPMSSQSANKQNAVATNSVTINNYEFSPMSITIKAGTTVTWNNQDDVHHTITLDSGSTEGPNSGQLGKGQSYSYTYKKAGTFSYHCNIHPEMHGTVTVT